MSCEENCERGSEVWGGTGYVSAAGHGGEDVRRIVALYAETLTVDLHIRRCRSTAYAALAAAAAASWSRGEAEVAVHVDLDGPLQVGV
ncbi:hypothetical protein NE236_03525 [Actinoallomurus purpureus]|uniref:hypothetical protein n=1 Tax=Actinoallomurus purpureus TaxID=478114 RepID=UPI0020934F5A|nr:hypothetical protein [Actinoallomurus purpureus]MCO6004039.1 hypothetical protein [Actinoallomurus purpureus]